MRDAVQTFGAIGRAEDGAQLARRPFGAIRAVVRRGGPLAQDALVGRVPRRTDDETPLDTRLDRFFSAGRHRSQQRGHRLTGGRAHGTVTRRGHDGAGTEEELRVVDDQGLGDHAAHGDADHVRLGDAQGGEERRGIVRHVLYAVGRGGEVRAREQRRDVGQSLELRGQPAVAVVVQDHEEAALPKSVDEPLRPGRELGTQPHDEEQRRIRGITLGDVLDLDPVDVGLRHGRLPSARLLAEFLPGGRAQRVIPSAGAAMPAPPAPG